MTDELTGLAKSSRLRTENFAKKLEAAMRAIESDIDHAGGLYPLNGGRLSIAELCRRAGVHEQTLMGKTHRASTLVLVKKWLEHVHGSLISGKRSVRKRVTERAETWESKYAEIAARFKRMYSVEIVRRDATIVTLQSRITELEEIVAALSAGQIDGRVTPFRR